ncbi:Biotin-requiring enzyme [Desulfonispora thiosulfatigenes DSM 11270]|uniref:Biotin-requiring enzyme n=1 Tax=Desulfonispora thiosulfatigenes DSM 11270 TaxID=656914 RepID=A0A1W1VJV8_DESTI|nr:biotin/lipoyl-containing protein [Desulfonispora thiosulfatigenes]SMB93510.1 Biotin-requiring enzyme [Desulfonispora thiosulfatigenes DSM 11270]
MKKFNIKVNGNSYEVEVEEVGGSTSTTTPISKPVIKPVPNPTPTPIVEKQVMPKTANASGEEVTSPMPGKILRVIKGEGSNVKAGEVVLILEAMKMENEITAGADGKITQMAVSEGATVQSGERLFILS